MTSRDARWPFPVPASEIRHYNAFRTETPLAIDGRLDEPAWHAAPRSPAFVDLVSGEPRVHDTRAAILWDDEFLYVGFWVEEPFVAAKFIERDALIWQDNDVEVFIAGRDAYYEFEINAFGTIYEAFFIWEDAYESGGFRDDPVLDDRRAKVEDWLGVGFQEHPRNPRKASFRWDFPGVRSAVHVDGTINDHGDRDRGWTAELAFPWKGMELLARADGRALPPRDGDVWRMDLSRFNQYKEAPPAEDSSGWAWSRHGVWDSHIPELFPFIHMSARDVLSVDRRTEEGRNDAMRGASK